MKCIKCGETMKSADLQSAISGTIFVAKKVGGDILDPTRQSTIDCFVCPLCGYIELYARNPKKFR